MIATSPNIYSLPAIALASEPNELSREVVRRLRARSMGLRQAIDPLVTAQREFLAEVARNEPKTETTVPSLLAFQERIMETLADRYDPLDVAVRESEIPFVEIDGAGCISYANEAFARHVIQPLGRDFSSLFGPRSGHVKQALTRGSNISLRLELCENGSPTQFRAEIGPLRDENGKVGAYGMLLSLRAEELRLETAQTGNIRVNLAGTVVFANPKAQTMLGLPRNQLLGRPASAFFRSVASGRADRVALWLRSTAARTENVNLTGEAKDPPRLVRCEVLPYYDDQGSRAGILITFRSIVEEMAQQELQRLFFAESDPLKLIRGVMKAVRAVIPYDVATFGIYTEDMKYFRTLVVEPEPDWHWGTRWFEIEPKLVEWLREGKTWNNNMARFVSTQAPKLKDDPVVLAMQKYGLRRFLTLPIRGAGRQFRSALSLISRDRLYGSQDLHALRNLRLEEILDSAETDIHRDRANCLRSLTRKLNAAANSRAAASTLANGVVNCFSWQHAAVYRVDRAKQKFVLMAQTDQSGDPLAVRSDYEQWLEDDKLGCCFREERALIATGTSLESGPFHFIKTADAQRSAMIVPLRVNGRIELILNITSSQENAFAGPDRRAIEDLASDCERILERRWHELISRTLMDVIDQAVVVIDPVGTIRQMNSAATSIFGPALGRTLESFGADIDDQAALRDPRPRDPVKLMLQIAEDVRFPILARQQRLNDDYCHRMWLFTNLREQQWERDWRFLDETVSEVARHTRLPLLIADGVLRHAEELLRKRESPESCASLLETAVAELAKIDFVFERLSDSLTVRQPPANPSTTFDVLETLREVIDALPNGEGKRVDFTLDNDDLAFPIDGWPDQLRFAFRSLLGYLLVVSHEQSSVSVAASLLCTRFLRICFTDPVPQLPVAAKQTDPLTEAEERAREMVSLAPDAICIAVQRHNGTFNISQADKSKSTFVIELPQRKD
jgi:PAS domain-containing protein